MSGLSGRPPYELRYDPRLRIERPYLNVDYEALSKTEREEFEVICQTVCSCISLQIRSFEKAYLERFEALERTEDDDAFYVLLDEMNEISSCISDLNVLFLHIEGRFLASREHA